MICHFCNRKLNNEPEDHERLYQEEEFICETCIEERKSWVSAEYGRQVRRREFLKGRAEQLSFLED